MTYKKFDWTDSLSIGVQKMDQQHQELIRRINALVEEAIKENNLDGAKLINFLDLWLRSHIMGIDMKYGQFANSQSQAS